MKLSDLLALHSSVLTENSNVDILGDAFLMQANPVYRNIKNHAIEIGCRYVEAWPEYLVMPLHALEKIVETKTIPYVPAARWLSVIEKKRTGVLTTDDVSIPESFHLHEAAHVIAENLFGEAKLFDPQEKILKTILCESFANSVDTLAWVTVADDQHRFFLRHNCYMNPSAASLASLVKTERQFGFNFLFEATLMAYLKTNFFRSLAQDFQQDKNPSNFDLEKRAAVEAIEQIAEKLDPLFRFQTTQMYLKLEGYDGDLESLLDFSFMKVFDANPVFQRVATSMASVVGEEARAQL